MAVRKRPNRGIRAGLILMGLGVVGAWPASLLGVEIMAGAFFVIGMLTVWVVGIHQLVR
jgi:hypothetical protein